EIVGGFYKKGDKIPVFPAGIETTLSKIEIAGEEVEEAFAPQAVVLHLADDIDISRGDTFVHSDNQPKVESEIEVLLCWLDNKPLIQGNKYFLQHKGRLLRTVIKEIEYKLDVNTLEHTAVTDNVKLNEVVKAKIKTAQPLVYDPFDKISDYGNAILVDETSNSTVAAVLLS
ncbi:MAG TPA: sulfate adenylyltransferase, partial [Niabella sp.]|nr:sulfate adenylyltransferase [Niabella sp.]